MEKPAGILRKARVQDVENMHALLTEPGRQGAILPRTRMDLYGYLRDFFVYTDEKDRLVGVAGLHICWDNLAEIRSVVVDPQCRGKGVGRYLIEACLDEAVMLGLNRVFILTYRPDFFGHFDFFEVDKSELPHKIWMDCVHCVNFPQCDEIAMICDLAAS